MIVHAQIDVPGPFETTDSLTVVSGLIGFAFQFILIVAGLYCFLQIVFAGYGMISSGGDKGHLEQARSRILWALVGLLVVLASWGMIVLVEKIFNIGLGFSAPISIGL